MGELVVVSLPEQENEYQLLQTADAEATARRLGLDLELVYADNNGVLQIQQVFKFIHAQERPRAIVVEPIAFDGMERVAQKATAAGIGWSVLNTTVAYVETLRRSFPALPVFSVASDQVEIGRIQGRQIRALLPAGGVVLYIQGPRTATPAVERLRGLEEMLAGSAVATIVLDGQWTESSAEQAVRSWLRLKTAETTRVALVAGQDDSMARGARRAIETTPGAAARFGAIPYLGIDGVPEVGQRLVASGQLTATVVMPSNTGAALEAIARWLQASRLPPPVLRMPVHSYPDETMLAQRAAERSASR